MSEQKLKWKCNHEKRVSNLKVTKNRVRCLECARDYDRKSWHKRQKIKLDESRGIYNESK